MSGARFSENNRLANRSEFGFGLRYYPRCRNARCRNIRASDSAVVQRNAVLSNGRQAVFLEVIVLDLRRFNFVLEDGRVGRRLFIIHLARLHLKGMIELMRQFRSSVPRRAIAVSPALVWIPLDNRAAPASVA